MRRSALAAALAALLAGAASAADTARAGRYDAELCVASRVTAEPTCGAADVEIAGPRLRVRIADIAYRLLLRAGELDVATMHGAMQIDEFSAPYEWQGDTLRFFDTAKDVRYEVRLGAKQAIRR